MEPPIGQAGASGSTAGKNLESQEDRSYKGSALHPCLKVSRKTSHMLGCAGKGIASWSRSVILFLTCESSLVPQTMAHFDKLKGHQEVQGLQEESERAASA